MSPANEPESHRRERTRSSEALPPSDPLAEDPTPAIAWLDGQSLTPRATLVGLAIGTLACFSNSYFGLQTGWISMMSLPLSLIGFAVFKAFSRHLRCPFSPVENVLVQTVAVAVGTMPLAAGLVGVIPALEKLLEPSEGGPLELNWGMLALWSLGVAFFGVFFAVPLRRQVIVREKYACTVGDELMSGCDFRVVMLLRPLFQFCMIVSIWRLRRTFLGKLKSTVCWCRLELRLHTYWLRWTCVNG